MDCCQRGVKNELIIETDQEQIMDKEGIPQDTDPALRSKKIEVETPNEIINDTPAEDNYNQENNQDVMEDGQSNMKEYEQNEPAEILENNEPNVETNVPYTDTNVIRESNNEEINEYNLPENNQNIGSEGIDTNIVQGELNIDQILNNYNEQQGQQSQNLENEEDYNKYFEQNPSQQNNNNDFDINQYLSGNNQTNQGNAVDVMPMFTFGENQTDLNNLINSNNAQTSQEYNYDYNYNV